MIYHTAKCLSTFVDTIHIDEGEHISFRSLVKIKGISKAIVFIRKVIKKNSFISWNFIDFLPGARYKIIKKLNNQINITALSWLLSRYNTRVLIAPPDLYGKYMKSIIKPHLTLTDQADMWPHYTIIHIHTFANIVLANTPYMYQTMIQKSKSVIMIGAGYFYKNAFQKFASKNIKQNGEKTILCAVSVNWRINFSLLLYLIKKLTDYHFLFIYRDTFQLDLLGNHRWQQKRGLLAQKNWRKITQYKNVTCIKEKNSIFTMNIKACVGIIPYATRSVFNQYAHPAKLYVYTALGIPVVSTPLKATQSLGYKNVYFTRSRETFVTLIRSLCNIHISSSDKKMHIREGSKQTFEQKAHDIYAIIKQQTF